MPAAPPSPMTIQVVSGIGRGPTELAAFDAALCEAGIENTNLIRLSSVLPPRTEVVVSNGRAEHDARWGDRLYVVYAETRSSIEGAEVWAGVSWVQFDDGRGLFVEHEGGQEQTVRESLYTSVKALCATRGLPAPEIVESVVVGAPCDGEPVCALVAAVFEAEGWRGGLR